MEKIYCGSGKKHAEWDLVNVSLCVSDIPKEHFFKYEGKVYVKLKVVGKKEVDKFGKTHYVEVDTYKPEENKEESHKPKGNMGAEPIKAAGDFEDFPF